MSDSNKPSKSWLATINNYTDADIALFRSWGPDVNRITAGAETAPTTGTKHLHVKITFKKAKRFSALKKLHPTANWSLEKFESDEALYCKKADTEQLFDINNRQQGKRTDLEDAVDAIKNGASEDDLWANHTSTMVRYHQGLLLAKDKLNPLIHYPKYPIDDYTPWTPISDWSKSHIIVGPANIGKTEFAKAHFPEGFLFCRHIDMLMKFNPKFHTGIVFDDMSFLHWNRNAQIHLLDIDNPSDIHIRYKTAHIPANTKKIFTCNPVGIPFDLTDEAIARRVTVTEVTKR